MNLLSPFELPAELRRAVERAGQIEEPRERLLRRGAARADPAVQWRPPASDSSRARRSAVSTRTTCSSERHAYSSREAPVSIRAEGKPAELQAHRPSAQRPRRGQRPQVGDHGERDAPLRPQLRRQHGRADRAERESLRGVADGRRRVRGVRRLGVGWGACPAGPVLGVPPRGGGGPRPRPPPPTHFGRKEREVSLGGVLQGLPRTPSLARAPSTGRK